MTCTVTKTALAALCCVVALSACEKAKAPANAAVAKAGEAMDKAGEAARAAATEGAEKAAVAAEAAKKAAAVAKVEGAKTAAVAAEGARKTAEAAAAGAAATAEAAKGVATAAEVAAANAKVDLTGALKNPGKATLTAPATYKAKFTTTKGEFVVQVTREWAPLGADRFYNLVKIGYLKDLAFFRVISGFMVQFGIHGDPTVSAAWRPARIADDPVKQSNLRGYITFATAGPNTRTTQMFINFSDNANLDRMGFAPFGKVEGEGMKVVDSIYSGYGEGAPSGQGPYQGRLQGEGNTYLKAEFPKLDWLQSVEIVQ